MWDKYLYLNFIFFIIYKTGYSLDYIFSSYTKICKQTNNPCQQCNCLYFHNNIKSNTVQDCPWMDIVLHGLTMRQILLMSLFFRYYDYEILLNQKIQLVDVMNGILNKDHKELNQKNIYANSLLTTLFVNNDNVIINENDGINNLISEMLLTKDYIKKYEIFTNIKNKINAVLCIPENSLYQFFEFINLVFSDFFKDKFISNEIIATEQDKILLMNLLCNIYKIILNFPHHVPFNKTDIIVSSIKTKMTGNLIAKKTINYLESDFDEERFSDFTSTDDIRSFIASIDSFYYIYKKYNIINKELYILFELIDYVEEIIKKSETSNSSIYNPKLLELLKEMLKIFNNLIKVVFNIDSTKLFE